MPRPIKPLTDTQIRRTKPPKLLVDGNGLALRVKETSSGITKTWVFNYYKPHSKKRTNIGLGAYPEVKLSHARALREEYRSVLSRNIDPKDFRIDKHTKALRALQNTFESVYREWVEIRSVDWMDSYRHRLTKAMELHILPGIGKLPINLVTREAGRNVIQPLEDRKAGETVTKLCRWCNEVMEYAVDCNLIDINPLRTLRRSFKKHRHSNRPWIKPEELPVLLSKIQNGSSSLEVKNLILWQLHTMVRPAEAAGTRWDEIDLEEKTWTIPPERMKGRKNLNLRKEKRVPHVVPLSQQAVSILESMLPISQHREYVFPARSKPREPVNSSTANVTIKRLGFDGYTDAQGKQGSLTAHGLRSTASTACNEAGFPGYVVEAALAHLDVSSIAGIYNHAKHLEQRRNMMQWWSNLIEEAGSGIKPKIAGSALQIVSHL